MPILTFSPMTASTDISMSSPIMMLWLLFRVRTSTAAVSPAEGIADPNKAPGAWRRNGQPVRGGRPVDLGARVGSLRRRLARRSLKPQLNQIRTWVRQGRTDAWIAHQLDASVGDIRSFKREHELAPEATEGETFVPGAEADEPDLRAEDDALVAEALEAERQAEAVADDEDEDADADSDDDGDADADGDDRPKRRRRGRRGGRGRPRTRGGKALEGTFDHGEEGYGLWLDPAVQDDATYAEHWAGHRPVTVTIEPDRIVISRAGEEAGDSDDTQVGADAPRGTGDED
jgi:hypothetical protein